MSYIRGRRNNAKLIATSWAQVQEAEGEYCIKLTQGQMLALVSQLQFLRWLTRWTDSPTQEEITTFADELESRLTVGCDCTDCDAVALCITDNDGVREALGDWFRDTEYNESIRRSEELLRSLGTGYTAAGCDKDALFGAITDVFNELNDSSLDFLQILDASTQVLELVSEWGEELTVLALAGSAPVAVAVGVLSVIATVVEQFITDLIQNYEAADTTELRDELRCEFLCYAELNLDCDFTAWDILEWLEPQIGFVAQDVVGLVAWFFGITPDISRETVLRLWYLELALYRFAIKNTLASIFVGQPARDQMVRLTRVALASEPTDAWVALCDVCVATWTHSFDFTVGNGGWTIDPLQNFGGTYSGRWNSQDVTVSGNQRRRVVRIARSFTSSVITGFTVNFNWTKGGGPSTVNGLRFYVNDGTGATSYLRTFAQLGATATTYTVNDLNITATTVLVDHTACLVTSPTAWTGVSNIESVTLRGTGVNPFI